MSDYKFEDVDLLQTRAENRETNSDNFNQLNFNSLTTQIKIYFSFIFWWIIEVEHELKHIITFCVSHSVFLIWTLTKSNTISKWISKEIVALNKKFELFILYYKI